MKKILHIITRLDAGGSASAVLSLMAGLGRRGLEAELVYGKTDSPEPAVRRMLEEGTMPLICLRHLRREPAPLRDFLVLTQLLRIIRRGNYDVVHTHSSKAGILGRVAARLCGVPAVHTPHGHIFYGYFGKVQTAFYIALERWAAGFTARLVSLTDRETEEALARGIGRREQYRTIPSGIPLRFFLDVAPESGKHFREQHAIPADAFLFVSIGRLVAVKGFDVLLRAFSRISSRSGTPIWLAIIGDGPERGALGTLAEQLQVKERAVFAGWQEDVRPALSAAQAFVLASRNEGMGRAFIEAMAAGVPVIGTDVGGVATVIRHDYNGLLVPAENEFALAEAMRRMVEDGLWRAAASERARTSVYPYYDEETMVEKTVALYMELAAGA